MMVQYYLRIPSTSGSVYYQVQKPYWDQGYIELGILHLDLRQYMHITDNFV